MPIAVPVPSQAKLEEAFRPYAQELGNLVYAWNRLQERLAWVFCIVGGFRNAQVAMAIWHSSPSNFSQRRMLRAATMTAKFAHPSAREEIIWLLNKVDNFLSDKRNDALHTPFSMMSGPMGIELTTDWMSSAPRAVKLRDKKLLPEFIWYRDYADILSRPSVWLDSLLCPASCIDAQKNGGHLWEIWASMRLINVTTATLNLARNLRV